MNGEEGRRRYVERVRDNTRSYIEEILREQRALERQLEETRLELTNLATLYAASYQLHTSLHRAEVVQAIQEIVVNLVGSEELAILRVDGGALTPIAAMGIDAERLAGLRRAGLLEAAERTGEPVAHGGDEPAADGVTACIPLAVAGRTLALIAIFRLLPQKPALGPLDMELFALLAQQAATALYCADLHEHHRGDP